MKFHSLVISFSILLLALSLVSQPRADELLRPTTGRAMIYGGVGPHSKAGSDTLNLMAARLDPTNGPGEPSYFGDFQSGSGSPDWNGWTHADITAPRVSHWQVSNYNQADPANYAAWCGDLAYAACDTADVPGGYGNYWHDLLEFRRSVPDPAIGTTVRVTATLTYDSEPAYDFTHLSYRYEGQTLANLRSWTGTGTAAVDDSLTFDPVEYLDGTDIAVYFRFTSDGGWSDEDCMNPTAGASQVDDINVHLVNGGFVADYFEDFEHGGTPDDFGFWNPVLPGGVGDFAKIWSGLGDLDPCVTNTSPQVAFIDDGVVVPGTGGSTCINWCYGPGGYIVNTTGGLLGPSEHLNNVIESPVMTWPGPPAGTGPDFDGILLTFGAYKHEDLTADAPGMGFIWNVRSADTDNSAGNGYQDIEDQPWRARNFFYLGGPEYVRQDELVTDLMNPGRDVVQVQLGVYEFGFQHGWDGNDGYPAPYFDNVTVKIFPHIGPSMSAREIDLAQDNFPQSGRIAPADPGSHDVRFDMATSISYTWELRNDPGDSVVVTVASSRIGASLAGAPELHYRLKRNPYFDPYRTAGLPDDGWVSGRPAVQSSYAPADRFAFDLPDTGFLFPGDVLHYYIKATDAIGGPGGADPRTAFLPADTTGFSTGFDHPLGYHSSFTVRALPGLQNDGAGGYEQPTILFINDFGNRGGEDAWYSALANAGLVYGSGYEVYYVNGPASGVGNGIGGRANAGLLQGYDEILYTSGDLPVYTIAHQDFNGDPGDDVGTLRGWLDQGEKDIFLTGDGLAADLAISGGETYDFLSNYLGLAFLGSDLHPLIGNQTSPLVAAVPLNPVFNGSLQSWIAFGGCPGINRFDAVESAAAATRLAEFTDGRGVPGAYTYAAATLNVINPGPKQSRAVSLPYDLMNIHTDPGAPGDLVSGRSRLMRDVLSFFGLVFVGDPTPVPAGMQFEAGNYPNPFNPRTTFRYSLPRAGHLKLSVYNVRGQLVKTLIDGPRPAGENQTVVWDGTDNQGSAAASGLYFFEARAADEVKTGKMTLLR